MTIELILRAYALHEDKKPILLYDMQQRRLFVYPYEPFKADLTPRSQASLTEQYEEALDHDQIVVFVRDNVGRRLVSYSGLASESFPLSQLFGFSPLRGTASGNTGPQSITSRPEKCARLWCEVRGARCRVRGAGCDGDLSSEAASGSLGVTQRTLSGASRRSIRRPRLGELE